jgi:signal transduction histidine kinase
LLKLDLVERQLLPQATAARASLTSARDLVEQTLDQLKAVIYDLRPAMLDDLGLVAALRWYAKARADKPGLEVVTSFDVGSRRLPSHVETALYRVGQEALANAVKYSEATKIELSLELKPGYASLRVFDNGRGFDLADARGRGIGLMSMRERVGLLDGKLNIVTEPGEGTRVYVVVPLSPGAVEETSPS